MGCWAGTDALTQLPIHYGEPTRFFIMTPSFLRGGDRITKGGNGFSYSHEIFHPYLMPILGTYDDYGCIDGIQENVYTEYFLQLFHQKSIDGNLIVTDNWQHPFDPAKPDFKIVHVLNWIERGTLKDRILPVGKRFRHTEYTIYKQLKEISDSTGKPLPSIFSAEDIAELEGLDFEAIKETRPFSCFLVLEDIYQAALKATANYGEFATDTPLGQEIDEHLQDEWERLKKGAEEDKKRWSKLEEKYKFDKEKSAFHSKSYHGYSGDDEGRADTAFHEMARHKLSQNDEAAAKEALQLYKEYKLFVNFMELSRKAWMVQTGAGGQHDGSKLTLALAEAVRAHVK